MSPVCQSRLIYRLNLPASLVPYNAVKCDNGNSLKLVLVRGRKCISTVRQASNDTLLTHTKTSFPFVFFHAISFDGTLNSICTLDVTYSASRMVPSLGREK